MNTTIRILFWLSAGKVNKKGQSSLMLRITHNKERKQIATGFMIPVEKWDNQKTKVKGNDEYAAQINTYIRNTTNRLLEIFNELAKKGDVYLENLYNIFMGKDGDSMTLMKLVNYHNEQMRSRLGVDYTVSTLKKYEVTKGKLLRFLKCEDIKDIRLKDLTRKFIADFDLYMKLKEGNDQNTTTKHCKNLKTIVNVGVFNGWLDKTPFDGYKTPYKVKEKVFLSLEELKLLEAKHFKINRLEVVKDLFLFQCYTGLAFADMEKLKGRDISIGIDGNRWIITHRRKTDVRSAIPLLPVALGVIEKHNSQYNSKPDEKLLPVYTNQKFNSYLQEIAELTGIDKNLTSHAGRRTFATTVALSNGVSIETISKILGHSSTKITHQYAVVTDLKVSEEMKKLKEKL
jgi:integrase